jgi:hypothetical protein
VKIPFFLCLTLCVHITAIFRNNNDDKSLRFYSFVIHCCMLWHHYSNSIPPVAHTVSVCTQNQFHHISYLSLTVLQPLCNGSFETVVRTKSCVTLLRVYSGKFLYSLAIARFPSFCLHHTLTLWPALYLWFCCRNPVDKMSSCQWSAFRTYCQLVCSFTSLVTLWSLCQFLQHVNFIMGWHFSV